MLEVKKNKVSLDLKEVNKQLSKLDMNNLFRLANLAVLPFWALMLIIPRAGLTKRIMSSNFIFLLMGAGYTSLLVGGLRQNPGGAKDIANPNLEGVVKLLSNRQGAFTGWMHFLALDLFVGRWIYFDSLERGKPARLAILLTLLAGPLGLTFYLLTRRGPAKTK